MSDVRCSVCKVLVGRMMPDGSVEIRERGRLVALVKWGRLGCTRCGHNAVLDVVPTRLVSKADQWEVVGRPANAGKRITSLPE